MTPRELFDACVRYLEAAGWVRDGQDEGIWIRTRQVATYWTFGDALTEQLQTDGVSMLEAGSEIQEAPQGGARVEASEPSGTQTAEALDYLVTREWLRQGFTDLCGKSSDALVLAALTGDGPFIFDYPLDRSDFRRCLLAYALAPSWLRERMRPGIRSYRKGLDRVYRLRWGREDYPRTSWLSEALREWSGTTGAPHRGRLPESDSGSGSSGACS